MGFLSTIGYRGVGNKGAGGDCLPTFGEISPNKNESEFVLRSRVKEKKKKKEKKSVKRLSRGHV